MKAFALIEMEGGAPKIDPTATPYHGHVICDRIGSTGWGAYLISGTGPQLLAIDALPGVVGIMAVTESEGVKWGELDGVPLAAVRTKLNIWLMSRDQPTIPNDWTARQVVKAIFKRANTHFDLDKFDIADV